MRISTSLLYQRGVDAIELQQKKLSDTEIQLATGERLDSPAEDPFASTRIIALDEEKKLLDLDQIKQRVMQKNYSLKHHLIFL